MMVNIKFKKAAYIAIVFFLLLQFSFSIDADKRTRYSSYQVKKMEVEGIKLHKRAQYDQAFEKFKFPAAMGYKGSQYFLGLMFLKGEHVDQSIILGMAWLGVANEANVKEWKTLYDSVYKKLRTEQKEHVDRKVKQYIQQYGMQAQDISCKKRPWVGHRINGPATVHHEIETVYTTRK